MVTLHIIPWILKLNISLNLRCGRSGCKGLDTADFKNAKEQDVFILQTEECLKQGGKEVKEIDMLPWHMMVYHPITAANLIQVMTELKDIAPPNGRAVIVFKARCGCPYAKIQACNSKSKSTEEERILSGAAAVCSICEKKCTNKFEIKGLPCYHYFHKACIDKSLKNNDLCPLCDSLDNIRDWEGRWDEGSLDDNDSWDWDDFVMV